MNRYEIPLAPQLQSDVKSIWGLEEEASTYNRDSVMPDSYIELVINCGAPLYMETGKGARIDMPQVFLNGVQRKPLHLRSEGMCHFVAVKMYSWGITPLLGVQANQTTETITPLDSHWQMLGKSIANTLQAKGYNEAMYQLQDYVCQISNPPPHDLHTIRSATQKLYDAGGQLRMEDLASQAALSTSQFERRFKYLTGVTPKTMARVIRFEAIRNMLFINPQRRISDLAQDFGYTDQAHFIHDFKAFASVTPGEFVNLHKEQWHHWRAWYQQQTRQSFSSPLLATA